MKTIEITKWLGTAGLVAATVIRALNMNHFADVLLTLIGVVFWFAAGLLMRDKPLIAVNGFSIGILLFGIFHG